MAESPPDAAGPGSEEGRAVPCWRRLAGRVERLLPLDATDPAREIPLVTDSKRITSVLGPVLWSMALTCGYASALGLGTAADGLFATSLPYNDDGRGAFWETVAGATANAAIVTAGVILVTCAFIALFALRLERGIAAFVCTAYAAFFFAFVALLLIRVGEIVPLDWVSLGYVAVNATGLFLWAVFVQQSGRVHNAALVLHCVSLTLPFMFCGDATMWVTLLLLVVWDLVAVLTPCGPLRYAMALDQVRQRRPGMSAVLTLCVRSRWLPCRCRWQHRKRAGDAVVLPSGLVYEGYLYVLGTGDMAFFAVLAGRAWLSGLTESIMCWTGIVAGVGVTVMATVLTRYHTLPALPVSLVLGMLAYWYARLVLRDYLVDQGGVAY